ncbi:MAG: hypothetical protein LBQ47_08765 [Endomicrobium sp.]|jgi:hypothetical protein|nr:hypothetical protein [Endomicrobium sp.]
MKQRFLVLLLFALFMFSDLAFAAGEASFFVFGGGAKNSSPSLQSKLMFVKEYCGAIVNITDDIKKSIASFTHNGTFKPFLSRAEKNLLSSFGFLSNSLYKKFFSGKISFFLVEKKDLESLCFIKGLLLISFLLLYIGLLRLFNAEASYNNEIFKIKDRFAA